MRLLVSVANAADASAALAGGADLIDAKDPSNGALGAVSAEMLQTIHSAVAGRRPLTAALGDAQNEAEIERAARLFAQAGVSLVKIGFTGGSTIRDINALIAAAVCGASDAGVVAVAYADSPPGRLPPGDLIDAAAHAGARGVLLDTADKHAPGLLQLMTVPGLEQWIAHAHAAVLFSAVAVQLTADDLPIVRDAGADVAGVRGAACEGGRGGTVVAKRVRLLRVRLPSTPLGPGKADITYV